MATVSLNSLIQKMKLQNLTPELDLNKKKIVQPDINLPALQLAGYFEHFAATRLKIIVQVEYTDLEGLEESRKREVYEQLFSYETPAFVFCRELRPDDMFMSFALEHQTPILSTSKSTSSFMAAAIRWLNVKLGLFVKEVGVLEE